MFNDISISATNHSNIGGEELHFWAEIPGNDIVSEMPITPRQRQIEWKHANTWKLC